MTPFTVIEELDDFKKNTDDTGRHTRQVIRHLDALRVKGNLSRGVNWNGGGGLIKVELDDCERPATLHENSPDNRIIAVAWHYVERGERTTFVSKDINARIKSDVLGISTADFEAQKVDVDRLYHGFQEMEVPADVIDGLYEKKELPIETVAASGPAEDDGDEPGVYPNQFILLKDVAVASHTGLARVTPSGDRLVPVMTSRKPVFGVMARNVQQTMALDLLLDDEVKLVTLLGTAGTGKTLLAVAAGLDRTLNEKSYERMLVARPIMPLGRDIGFLPGDVDEKLSVWMQPIFVNLSYVFSSRIASGQQADTGRAEKRIEELMESGQLVLEPLTYIRGRSIPNQFLIVDEAQNLTPHEVKTIASRVGEGTKLVLTGDIAQIDNPYLDSASNGLSYSVEQLKGQGIVGHVMLTRSERSSLASLVADKL